MESPLCAIGRFAGRCGAYFDISLDAAGGVLRCMFETMLAKMRAGAALACTAAVYFDTFQADRVGSFGNDDGGAPRLVLRWVQVHMLHGVRLRHRHHVVGNRCMHMGVLPVTCP